MAMARGAAREMEVDLDLVKAGGCVWYGIMSEALRIVFEDPDVLSLFGCGNQFDSTHSLTDSLLSTPVLPHSMHIEANT